MIWQGWVTLGVVGATLFVLARNWLPAEVAVTGGMAALALLGALFGHFPTPAQMVAGYGNEAIVVIGVLFVIAAALTETGGMALVAEKILGRPRSVAGAQARLMLPVVTASSVINNTPLVAMFMPIVRAWCRRTGLAPSKLFIPLSYAAILGGVCTLIGTSSNLVVQGLLAEAHLAPLGLFTLTVVGVPVAIAGVAWILIASRWLLPHRPSVEEQHADPRQYTVEMMVEAGGTIEGQTIEQAGLRHLPGLYLMHVERDGEALVAVGGAQILRGDDRVVFVGLVTSIVDLQRFRGLRPATDQVFKLTEPRPNRCLVEAVLSGSCPIVGQSVREGRFRSRYDAAVIAVHRNGERLAGKIGDIVLRGGDTLLLETHPRFYEAHRNSPDFFLVSTVPDSAPPRHDRAGIALAILALMVAVVASERYTHVGLLPASLVAAGLLLATRCLSIEQARRAIQWPVLITIGGALGMGRAIETSGAAEFLGRSITGALAPLGATGVLAGVYLCALVLAELVNHSAAAAITFPIAHAAAAQLGVDFTPFAVCIAIGVSCAFASPLGYQTHLMVYGPGGYRFADYVKIGLPLDLIVMAVAVGLTPAFYPLRT